MASRESCVRCGEVYDENHCPCYRGYREAVLQLRSCFHPWPDEFGFPPGEVVIDRSRPLVLLPDSTLPNHVAISESWFASMPSSNDDATEQQTSESSCVVGRGQDDAQDHQDDWRLTTSQHHRPFGRYSDVNHVAVSEASSGRRAIEQDDATVTEQTDNSSSGSGQDGLVQENHHDHSDVVHRRRI